MWSGNLAPDHADLGAADLLLATVDEGDLLAKVEAVCIGISTGASHCSGFEIAKRTWRHLCCQHPRS